MDAVEQATVDKSANVVGADLDRHAKKSRGGGDRDAVPDGWQQPFYA
jgi:hypothetical protein